MPVLLSKYEESRGWEELGTGSTDTDGYTHNLLPVNHVPAPGKYRLVFILPHHVLFPHIDVEFMIIQQEEVYHFLVLFDAASYTVSRIPLKKEI